MLERTNDRITEQERQVRRRNRRRYVFQRTLEATDRVLWRLAELNRDGVTRVPRRVRVELGDVVGTMPVVARDALRDRGQAQDTPDGLFEVRERLLRRRYPDWRDFDPDELGDESMAS